MATYTVTLSSAEEKVLLSEMADVAGIQAWLENIVKAKATRIMDKVLLSETDSRPDLMTQAEKEAVIDSIDVKPASREA